MTYKKLFDIVYNNKKFTIFLDENNRRTFLEINKDGEYIYPDFEDFKALNEIYNNHNPFVCFAAKKFTFKEKVRMSTMILAAILSVNIAYESMKAKGISINDADKVVEVGIAKFTNSYVEIKDLKELDDILGYKTISSATIHEAIDKNPNLTLDLKEMAHKEINETLEDYPDADLRVAYENLKTLNLNMFPTIEDLQANQDNQNVSGSYDVVTNTINLYEGAPDEVKAHELRHAFYCFYRKLDGKVIIRTCNYGHSLDEAMTNKLTYQNVTTYKNEGVLLDYLLSSVEFDFYDYNNRGIWSLIEKLKSDYPDVDIDYIVMTSDSIKDTLINLSKYIYLDEAPEFLDELFLLATKQINLKYSDVYEPFYKFARLFSCVKNKDLIFDYLNRYNEYLLSLGYANVKDVQDIKRKCEVSKDFSGLAYTHNFVSPVVVTQTYENYAIVEPVDAYGNIIDDPELLYNIISVNNMANMLVPEIIKNADYGTPEFWQSFALKNNLLSESQIKSVPIYLNGKYLQDEFLGNLVVQIGCDENGKVGYILSFENGTVLYSSSNSLSYLSDQISFTFFFEEELSDIKSLDLGNYLTEEKAKKAVRFNPSLYEKISLINGELVFHPAFNVIIDITDMPYNGLPSGIILEKSGKSIVVIINGKSTYIPMKIDEEFTFNSTTLDNILIEMGILNEHTTECILTISDLNEILNSYVSLNRAR